MRSHRLCAELSVLWRFGYNEAQLLLGVDRTVPVVEQLDREFGERPAVTTQLAGLLQRRLPLLGLDAILLAGTILANARDLNEPSHQNSVGSDLWAGTRGLVERSPHAAFAGTASRAPRERSRKRQ